MKQFIKIALLLIIVIFCSNSIYAQTNYKQQVALERKAYKISNRLGINKARVVELLKKDKQETKQYINFLKHLDTSNDEAMMQYSTNQIMQLKTDCKYYANRAARRRNRAIWGGLAAFMAGCGGIASGCDPLMYAGIGVGSVGLVTYMYQYVKVTSGNDLSSKLYRTSRTLIVDNPIRPMMIDFGNDAYLQAGTTIMRNTADNSIAVGPSIAITF